MVAIDKPICNLIESMNLHTVTFISTLATLALVFIVNNFIARARDRLRDIIFFAGSCMDIGWGCTIVNLLILGIPFSCFVTMSLAPFFSSQPIYLVTSHLVAIALFALISFLMTLIPLTISVFVVFQGGLLYGSYFGIFLTISSFFGCLVYMVLSKSDLLLL